MLMLARGSTRRSAAGAGRRLASSTWYVPTKPAAASSGRLRDVVQDQQFRPWAGGDRIGTTFVVAELHERGLIVELFHDRADLPACKSLRGKVREQCHHVQKGWIFGALPCLHHSTQQVTNPGTFSRIARSPCGKCVVMDGVGYPVPPPLSNAAYFLDCGVAAPRTLPQGSVLAFLSGILLSPDL
jgi:hypothetical protein